MIRNSYFLMSLRYLQAANKNSTIKTMMKICCGGIFLGSFSLALIISIMQGFEEATYLKMKTVYPEIIIDADGQELNYEQIEPILKDPIYKILNFAPQWIGQALCSGIESDDMPHIIQIKGKGWLNGKNLKSIILLIERLDILLSHKVSFSSLVADFVIKTP